MLDFTFDNPTVIHFGKNSMEYIAPELEARGVSKVLLVTGMGSVKKNGIFDRVIAELEKAGAGYVELSGVHPNPRVDDVRRGIAVCREFGADLILAVGGGSVIDAAKAVAAGVLYEGDVWDFFDPGDIVPEEALPMAAVLTLAATGSEMNQNAVITNEASGKKLAVSSPALNPVFSVMDPRNTFTVNAYHTAAGIADIMAHVFEYYLTPMPGCQIQDSLDEAILKTCVKLGPKVLSEPCNYDARANIMWASTLALNGISGKGKDADFTLHMIEHEVSAINDMSHGAGLAIIIPNLMKVQAEKHGPELIAAYGRNVWGIGKDVDDKAAAEQAIRCTGELFASMGLPSRLGDVGITSGDIDTIASGALTARRTVAGLDQLTRREIERIIELSM